MASDQPQPAAINTHAEIDEARKPRQDRNRSRKKRNPDKRRRNSPLGFDSKRPKIAAGAYMARMCQEITSERPASPMPHWAIGLGFPPSSAPCRTRQARRQGSPKDRCHRSCVDLRRASRQRCFCRAERNERQQNDLRCAADKQSRGWRERAGRALREDSSRGALRIAAIEPAPSTIAIALALFFAASAAE